MQIKYYITIGISLVALCFSFISLIFTFLNFKRNSTKVKVQQIHFFPNPFHGARPNKLFLDGKQSSDLWAVFPTVHLVVYLKIDNLSHTGITISNFIINDSFLVSNINTNELKDKLPIRFFSCEESYERDLLKYGISTPIFMTSIYADDYKLIKIGDRIDSKSSIEGILIVSGNWNLYNAIKNGINKLTIVTSDKKFKSYINISKTIIPDFSKGNDKS